MKTKFFLSCLLAATGLSTTAFASGFEKSIPWGGQTSGVAGIGTPYMQGSQALFFNPAGLAGDKVGMDVSLNLSPTWPKFKGPVASSSTQESSQSKTLVPFALIYGATINDSLGFAVGGYTSAGTYADYTNLSLSPLKGNAEVRGDLIVNEIAAGVGYKIMDGLKIGASWRIVSAKANFGLLTAGPVANSVVESNLHDLKDTEYTGFKLGAQYKLGEKTNFGLTYRSEVNFKAKGTFDGTLHTLAGTNGLASQGVTVGTTLPTSITLGATHDCTETWRVLGEYVWTQYSKVDNLAVQTDSGSSTPVILKFKDQHNIRLAGDYHGMMLPIRFGYIWTSQVTDSDHALAILAPPGSAHTVTLGTGYTLLTSLKLDGGLEYTMASASGTGASAQYQVNEFAAHLGAAYSF